MHQAKVHDLAIVEDDCCLEQEIHVTTGCTLVQMHVTDRAEAQEEDPILGAVLNWLEHRRR